MPVEFLTDEEAAAFGRYGGSVPQADLERYFFLDDGDRAMVSAQRGDHNRLGFSIQLATVRYIGRFQPDPMEGVPAEAIDFLAGQLGIAGPSCVKKYALRQETHREHAGKIQKALKLKDFSALEGQRNGEWRYLEFLQVTSLITADIFVREIPDGTRARHRFRPVDLPEHRY